MEIRNRQSAARAALIAALVFAYFFCYPQDLVDPIEKILNLSYAIAPGMYALIGLSILSWTLIRIWGKPSAVAPKDAPPA